MDNNKSLKQIINFRLDKLKKLKDNGVDVYPEKFKVSHSISELKNGDTSSEDVQIAGRITSIRSMGNATFSNINDFTGKQQIFFKKNNLPENQYKNLIKLLDIGDIIGIKGNMFLTKTKELTLNAKNVILLSKNIRPLPNLKEKDGIAFNTFDNKELRYRYRHLDFIANPENKQIFINRSAIINEIRLFFNKLGFIEVETPILQNLYGGANAKPFKTYHNSLDRNLYLRIATELYLKRLLIGGFDKIYEIGKNFRNEGIDHSHNPEFTAIEIYESYKDLDYMMILAEKLFKQIGKKINKNEFIFNNHKIKMRNKFKKFKLIDLFKKYVGKDFDFDNKKIIDKYVKKYKLSQSLTYAKKIDKLLGLLVEPELVEPTFIVDYPKILSPLSKSKINNPSMVHRFELFIGGVEFANAFSELNDPIDQRQRFEEQMEFRDMGDEEASIIDEDFINALECGMPPAGGMGIGIDRMIMLFTEQKSIKDVILFPTLRSIK